MPKKKKRSKTKKKPIKKRRVKVKRKISKSRKIKRRKSPKRKKIAKRKADNKKDKKEEHWANIPKYNWWDGWWKVKPRNIWETTIEIIWKNYINPKGISGFEYWATKLTENDHCNRKRSRRNRLQIRNYKIAGRKRL